MPKLTLVPTWLDIRAVVSQRANEFVAQLRAVRDGGADGVHDARVASRQLRELLPMMAGDPRSTDAQGIVTKAGRALGTVRDLDVMIDVLDRKNAVVPAAALAIASARRTLSTRADGERRSLIKTLEQLELDRVRALKQAPTLTRVVTLDPIRRRVQWLPILRDRIRLRADRLRAAVDHATGVYFPNRLHAVRVATKKLRYTVEAAVDLHAWKPPHMLKDLKKIQATLGELHDAQLLRDRLDRLIDICVPQQETTTLIAALDADIVRLHAEYMQRRDRLDAITVACRRYSAHEPPAHATLRSALRLVQRRAS